MLRWGNGALPCRVCEEARPSPSISNSPAPHTVTADAAEAGRLPNLQHRDLRITRFVDLGKGKAGRGDDSTVVFDAGFAANVNIQAA